MVIGENRTTNILLRILGEKKRTELENFVQEIKLRPFQSFENESQVFDSATLSITKFLENLTEKDLLTLRSYTGYQFKNINAVLRKNWNYEEHGLLTEEVQKKYEQLSQDIERLVSKFPSLEIDFAVYRGVDLNSFKNYGINSLEELRNLQDKYLYEEGFTSTSILKETSYFKKQLETGKNYNVEIKYLIPSECQDGALLQGQDLTYSPSQNEYLINRGSLTKIIEVKIDEEQQQAYLTGVLIPKEMWNIYYKQENKDEIRAK